MPRSEREEAPLLRLALEAVLDGGLLPAAVGGGQLSAPVQQMVSAIHADPFDPLLNVQAIKTRCRILDNNVSSRFRREVGLSVKDYIDRLRLETARLLLRDPRATVFDVCQSVGYYHPQTFYRAFHRSFRCTPGNLRVEHV